MWNRKHDRIQHLITSRDHAIRRYESSEKREAQAIARYEDTRKLKDYGKHRLWRILTTYRTPETDVDAEPMKVHSDYEGPLLGAITMVGALMAEHPERNHALYAVTRTRVDETTGYEYDAMSYFTASTSSVASSTRLSRSVLQAYGRSQLQSLSDGLSGR
jgi:hypothetical protein